MEKMLKDHRRLFFLGFLDGISPWTDLIVPRRINHRKFQISPSDAWEIVGENLKIALDIEGQLIVGNSKKKIIKKRRSTDCNQKSNVAA